MEAFWINFIDLLKKKKWKKQIEEESVYKILEKKGGLIKLWATRKLEILHINNRSIMIVGHQLS